jgi:hypothetical protein
MEGKEPWKNNSVTTSEVCITVSERHPTLDRKNIKSKRKLAISSTIVKLKRMPKTYGVRKKDIGLRILLGMGIVFILV